MDVEKLRVKRSKNLVVAVPPIFNPYYDSFLDRLSTNLRGVEEWDVDRVNFFDGTETIQVVPRYGTVRDIKDGELAQTAFVPFWIGPWIIPSSAYFIYETTKTCNALLRSENGGPPLVNRIIGINPYFEERLDHAGVNSNTGEKQIGESIDAEIVPKTLAVNGLSEFETLDIHSWEAWNYIQEAKIKCLPLTAARLFAEYLHENQMVSQNTILVALDKGSLQKNLKIARLLGLNSVDHIGILDKPRKQFNLDDPKLIYGDPKGKDVVIFDDIIDTGGSIEKVCKYLKEAQCRSITLTITHGVLSSFVRQKIEALVDQGVIDHVVLTDSLPTASYKLKHLRKQGKVTVLRVEPMLAKYAKLIHKFGVEAIINSGEFSQDILIPKNKEEISNGFKHIVANLKLNPETDVDAEIDALIN